MRVLLCVPFVPHLSSHHAAGSHIGRLVELLQTDVDLYVFWPWDADPPQSWSAGLQVVRMPLRMEPRPSRYIGLSPASLRADWPKQASRAALEAAVDCQADVIHAEYLQTAEIGVMASRMRSDAPPVVLGLHDVTAALASEAWRKGPRHKRAYRYLEYRRVAAFEAAALRSSGAVVCLSAADATRLQPLVPGEVYVAPPPVPVAERPSWRPGGRSVVTFAGAMWRHANALTAEYLVRDVMPAVWASVPQARLRIVGARPSPVVRALAGTPGVEVTGSVDSLADEFQVADVVVAPTLLGGGILMKVLEPMSLGCPVVTNSLAAAGIGSAPGVLAVENSPTAMADAVIRLLLNKDAAKQLGERAYNYVAHEFTPDRARNAYLAAYSSAIGGRVECA